MRIVSLCPSITETLVDLGVADSLVGVTRFCIHPREVTRRLPKVGGTKDPDIEAIVRAKPDLIFLNEEENTREAFESLAPRFDVDVTFPRTIAEVPANLRHFGRRVGREARGEARARELEAALEDLDARRRADPRPPFSFAYVIWREPWMTANGDTYASDLWVRAGGINAFASAPDRYPVTSLEALAERGVDLVLLPDEPFRFRERHRDEVQAAVPSARVELVSGDDCSWHGVRTLRGVQLVVSARWGVDAHPDFAAGRSPC